MSNLELMGLNKSYGPFQALQDIDLAVNQGEFIVTVGPSGSGKSTLLKAIAGLEPLDSGTIRLNCPGLDRFEVPVKSDCPMPVGGSVTLGLRPESIRPTESGFNARVSLVEHLGRETVVYADASPLCCIDSETGTGNLVMHLPEVSNLHNGESLALGFDARAAYVFAGSDERNCSLPVL